MHYCDFEAENVLMFSSRFINIIVVSCKSKFCLCLKLLPDFLSSLGYDKSNIGINIVRVFCQRCYQGKRFFRKLDSISAFFARNFISKNRSRCSETKCAIESLLKLFTMLQLVKKKVTSQQVPVLPIIPVNSLPPQAVNLNRLIT